MRVVREDSWSLKLFNRASDGMTAGSLIWNAYHVCSGHFIVCNFLRLERESRSQYPSSALPFNRHERYVGQSLSNINGPKGDKMYLLCSDKNPPWLLAYVVKFDINLRTEYKLVNKVNWWSTNSVLNRGNFLPAFSLPAGRGSKHLVTRGSRVNPRVGSCTLFASKKATY